MEMCDKVPYYTRATFIDGFVRLKKKKEKSIIETNGFVVRFVINFLSRRIRNFMSKCESVINNTTIIYQFPENTISKSVLKEKIYSHNLVSPS